MSFKLCYLCHYPVVDGGVRIQALDQKKLSQWWLDNLQTEFESAGNKKRRICKFCVWDARNLHENDEHINEESVWWPENTSKIYEHNRYYLEGQIKPCSVKIENIKHTPSPSKEKNADNPLIYKCYFCNKTSQKYGAIHNHILKIHPGKIFFNCDYVACLHLHFTSEEEKKKHINEHHSRNSGGRKVLRCVYCEKLHLDYKSLWADVKVNHQKIVVKCSYEQCGTYLKCEADRQQHEKEKHQSREKAKKCIYCDKWTPVMSHHVRSHHNHVAIKCNYNSSRCSSYFKSESDRDEHIKAVHLAGKIKQMVDCIFCGLYYSNKKISSHIAFMHRDKAIKCSLKKCAQYFKNQDDCDKHFKERHEEKEKLKTISCSQCSYTIDNMQRFQQHYRNLHGKEKLKCAQCPASEETYKSKHFLKAHITKKHSDVIVCPHCNISTRKYALHTHLVSEYCSLCKVNYLCPGTMKEHKKWCKQKRRRYTRNDHS